MLNSAERGELIEVALGKSPADMVIRGGDIVNVYTGEILPQSCVAVKGKRIAYVGEYYPDFIGPQTLIIEAVGKTIIPGLIDCHAHILWYYSLEEFLKYSMQRGTTTTITEALEICFPLGKKGFDLFLKMIRDQPVKLFTTVPGMQTISPLCLELAFSPQVTRRLLKNPQVIGLGETYWPMVLANKQEIFRLYDETLYAGKRIEGHTAGAKGRKLSAVIASGISSCHEPISEEEVLERLRQGLYVMIREGSVRRELERVSKLKGKDIDTRRLILVSDGLSPKDLFEKGHMDYILQKAIDLGFDPIKAIQMVTLNGAEHFGLDHEIGGLAPPRYADIVIIPELRHISAEYVISNGKIIAKEGKLLVPPRKERYLPSLTHTVKLPRALKEKDFMVNSNGLKRPLVRVIEMVGSLVSKEKLVKMKTQNGQILPDLCEDILKVAAIDRILAPGKIYVGFIKGFGIRSGAFASSSTWDTTDIIAVGTNDRDLALVVNRVAELQGGVVVADQGKILAEVPLPLIGLLSLEPLEVLHEKLEVFQKKAEALGSSMKDAHLSLTVLTSPAIPRLRICESGLVNTKEGVMVDLIAE